VRGGKRWRAMPVVAAMPRLPRTGASWERRRAACAPRREAERPPEKHAVRRVGLPTPSTRHHQRSGREHRCYADKSVKDLSEANHEPESAHHRRDRQYALGRRL